MRILLYNPDNGVTRNFMPHLWMFLLQALTPSGHEVLLIDGNAQPMDEEGIARFVREENIGLVGIGAMTRMIAKAYRMADAVRAAGVPVVMGGWAGLIGFRKKDRSQSCETSRLPSVAPSILIRRPHFVQLKFLVLAFPPTPLFLSSAVRKIPRGLPYAALAGFGTAC